MNPRIVVCVTVLLASCVDGEDIPLEELGRRDQPLSVSGWAYPLKLTQKPTPVQPALTYWGSKLHMVRADSDGSLWWSSYDRYGWTTDRRIPDHYATGKPALAVFEGNLWLAYRQRDTNHIRVTRTSGTQWTAATTVAEGLCAPSMTTAAGKVYVASCLTDIGVPGYREKVLLQTFDGTRWEREADVWAGVPRGTTLGVAIAYYGGQIHVFATSIRRDFILVFRNDDYYVHESAGEPGQDNYSLATQVNNMRSKNPPAVTVCDGYVHLAVTSAADDASIWWTHKPTTETDWAPDVELPNRGSRGGVGLGCYRGREAHMLHNAGDNALRWSPYVD